jgi:hypothetical protein
MKPAANLAASGPIFSAGGTEPASCGHTGKRIKRLG